MILVHKIAMAPNNKQRTFFAKSAGTARFSYNWALDNWKKQYEAGLKPSEAKLRKELNSIKKESYPWMLEVGKCAPQQAIKDLGVAFDRFFNKKSQYPQFKKKGLKDSFRVDNGPARVGAHALKVEGGRIRIPRLGQVKLREELRFQGQIKSGVISLKAGRWFISISIEIPQYTSNFSKSQGAVGVDLGITRLATLSTGEVIDGPKAYKQNMKRLKFLQKNLSRKEKGSKNRYKQRLKVQKLHAKIANIRSNSLHQLTHMLTKQFSVIGIEDLNIKRMLKNPNLSCSISDMGFAEFKRQLKYKAEWRNCRVHIVDTFFPSSKLCSKCDYKKTDLTLKDRIWNCPNCNAVHDRDINAAENLKIQAESSSVTA